MCGLYSVVSRCTMNMLLDSRHTNVGTAKETTALGGRGLWRWVLDLRRSRRARLAHRVCAMHDGLVFCDGLCVVSKRVCEVGNMYVQKQSCGINGVFRVSPGSGRVLVCIRRLTGEAGCDVTTSCFDHRMSRAYTGLASSHHTTMQIQRSCHCPGNWKPLSPSCRALHLEISLLHC